MKLETKEKATRIWGDVKVGLEKGYSVSKVGLKKAGVAIQKFSDISVVAVEKKQFESKRKKVYLALGELVAKKLSVKNAVPLKVSDEEVSSMLKEIVVFNKEISQREKALKEFEGMGKKTTAKGTTKKSAKAASKTAKKPVDKK